VPQVEHDPAPAQARLVEDPRERQDRVGGGTQHR
jgi:hypothetical protein